MPFAAKKGRYSEMPKPKIVFLLALCLISVVLMGCRLSKADYEKKVSSVLHETKAKINKITEEANREVRPTCLPTLRQQMARNKKYLTVFERLDKKLKELTPPEEYEEGHRILIKQVEWTISALKLSQQILQGKRESKDVKELEAKLEQMGDKLQLYEEKVDRKLPFTRLILQTPE